MSGADDREEAPCLHQRNTGGLAPVRGTFTAEQHIIIVIVRMRARTMLTHRASAEHAAAGHAVRPARETERRIFDSMLPRSRETVGTPLFG